MKSGYRELIWSDDAIVQLQNLIKYLDLEWGQKVGNEFLHKMESWIEVIKEYPEVFPVNTKLKIKNIRRCVINKNVSLLYRLSTKRIIIYSIKDNRTNYFN